MQEHMNYGDLETIKHYVLKIRQSHGKNFRIAFILLLPNEEKKKMCRRKYIC